MSNIYALTDTWNNVATTFSAIQMDATDTTSAAASMLLDLRKGGVQQMSVLKDGSVQFYNAGSLAFGINQGSNTDLAGTRSGTVRWLIGQTGAIVGSAGVIGWSNATSDIGGVTYANADTRLTRVAAGVVKIGNASGNAGAIVTATTTVASLPAAATAGAGARAFVTDATASTFASTVAGGGSTKVPVYCDGTAWYIG